MVQLQNGAGSFNIAEMGTDGLHTGTNAAHSWEAGTVLPGGYRILRLLGQGGMGRVYLVQQETHRKTNLKFAVKVIRENTLSTDRRSEAFFRELRNWMDLPKHRNLTQCNFFKTIYETTAVFAEFVDGGSLRHWVKTGRLNDVKKIWDIAIQSALGLQTAHEWGMIHLDVKPANLLLNHKGILKITDFGLSVGYPDRKLNLETASVRSSSHGMTPAFASVEQLKDLPLDNSTDQWSWAATILYIFIGRVTWQYGIFAPKALCDLQIESNFSAIPKPFASILERSFMENPSDRWASMGELANQLQKAYEEYFNEPYHRETPEVKNVLPRPTVSHGRSVSSHEEQIDKLLERVVIAAGKDLQDVLEALPRRDGSGRTRHLLNLEYLNRIERELTDLKTDNPVLSDTLMVRCNLQKVHLLNELDDQLGAMDLLRKTSHLLDKLEGRIDERLRLSESEILYNYQGGLQLKTQQYSDAQQSYDLAEAMVLNRLKIGSENDAWSSLYRIRMNQAVVIGRLGLLQESVDFAEKCISELLELKGRFSEITRLKYLAGTYANKAASLGFMDRDKDAGEMFLQAADVVKCLINDHEQTDLYFRLVHVLQGAAHAMMYCGEYARAEELASETVGLVQSYLKETSNQAIHAQLQASDIILHILTEAGRLEEAFQKNERLITVIEYWIYQRGKMEIATELLKTIKGKLFIVEAIGDTDRIESARKELASVKSYFNIE